MPILTRERAPHPSPLGVGALAFVLGLVGSIPVDAEIISVPTEASSSPVAAPPPPTVLRGSPPSTDKSVPICPPGYTLAPGYGCLAPSTGEYPSDWQYYGYWPGWGWGWGYGYGWFPFSAGSTSGTVGIAMFDVTDSQCVWETCCPIGRATLTADPGPCCPFHGQKCRCRRVFQRLS
jgi:hypothetical protein